MNKNIKKALALLLVIVLTASVTLGVTLALLTDETEVKHNVFTSGNVKIDLTEKVDGDTYGGVSQDGDIGKYLLVAPGDELTKEVKVKNTGSIPAYVAVTVTMNNADKINAAIDEYYEALGYTPEQIQAIYDLVFENWGLRYDKNDAEGNALGMRLTNQLPTDETLLRVDSTKTTKLDDTYFYAYSNWFQTSDEKASTSYGRYPASSGYYAADMGGYEWNYTYYLYLEPGESYILFTGINVPEYFKNDQMAMFDGLEIDIQGAAIQAENFDDPKEAFTALRAEQGGTSNSQSPVAIVSDADGLVEALENDQDVLMIKDVKIDPANMSNAYGRTGINVKNGQTIDGGGKTLDIRGAGGTWDSGINTTGGLIKNITITGSFRGIFINHNSTYSEPVVLENVIIDGTTYTISCDQGMNQTFSATNSTFNGWTSYAATLGEAEFENCTFGEGNGYAYCRPYAPTTFVGCDFAAGYTVDARAAVTFENCTIGGEPLTAENLSTLVTSIANATVK